MHAHSYMGSMRGGQSGQTSPFSTPSTLRPATHTNSQVIHSQLADKGMRCQGMNEVKGPPRFPALCSPSEENLPGNSLPGTPNFGDKKRQSFCLAL